MSQKTREELLPRLRMSYASRSRAGKTLLLNEFCEQWQCDRKHAIKLLGGRVGWGGAVGKRRGAPLLYTEEVIRVVEVIWRVAQQPCGKRLKAALPLWLPYYEGRYGALSETIRGKVLAISAAQIDRLLAPKKVRPHGLCGTKPGSLIRNQIPIRTDNFDISMPGYMEVDSVAHCGQSLIGDFIWSLTYTDIFSGWTCNRAVWNKGYAGVIDATKDVEATLPFKLLGFDCDNGTEFLNWHLVRYLQERPRPVGFTRSRPYKKNDNAHVEQKNWSHVRQLLGYDRLDAQTQCALINKLYQAYWEPLNNYFGPSAKLVEKSREGAKIKKRHDVPMTPCDRLLQSDHLDEKAKQKLRDVRQKLNPFELVEKMEKQLSKVFAQRPVFGRPTASLQRAFETTQKR